MITECWIPRSSHRNTFSCFPCYIGKKQKCIIHMYAVYMYPLLQGENVYRRCTVFSFKESIIKQCNSIFIHNLCTCINNIGYRIQLIYIQYNLFMKQITLHQLLHLFFHHLFPLLLLKDARKNLCFYLWNVSELQ